VTLAVFADENAESHACAPVALVAQLVQADDFGFDVALRSGGSGRNRSAEQSAKNSCRGEEWSCDHRVVSLCSRPDNTNSIRYRSVLWIRRSSAINKFTIAILNYQFCVIKQTSVRQSFIHRPEHSIENRVDLDRRSRQIASNKNEKGDYQWP
jgi:hypothetical protein